MAHASASAQHAGGGGGGLVLLATLATHAIFFGSGRYALVVFPLVTGLGLAELLGAGRAPKAPEAS